MDDRAVRRNATALWNDQWPTIALALASFAGGFATTRSLCAPQPHKTEPPSAQTFATGAPDAQPASRFSSASNSGARPGNPLQPLQGALAEDDPFISAARVTEWLKTADIETFHRLAEKPEEFPLPAFRSFQGELSAHSYAPIRSEFRSAWYASLAARWLEVDPEHALAAMQRVDAALTAKGEELELLSAFAKLRPETALETLPLDSKDGGIARYAYVAFEELSSRDHNAARRFLERVPDGSIRDGAESAINWGLARKDPVSAAAIAAASGDERAYWRVVTAADHMDTAMVRQVLQAGGALAARVITPQLILRHPGLAEEVAGADVPAVNGYGSLTSRDLSAAESLSPAQRERLLDACDSLPGAVRDSVAAAVASCWARTEPRKAADWAVAHGRADDGTSRANSAAQQVFLRWINNDPDAALAWWRELPASALRDALGTNASSCLAENGRIDEALETLRPHADPAPSPASSPVQMSSGLSIHAPDGTAEESAVMQLAQVLAQRDPDAAGAWYATLPAGAATEHTARILVQNWYDRSPEALARWIESLPPGGPRDHAARAFVERAAQQSPSGAAEWVETVADPHLRQQAALWVWWQWRADDPAGAREWIANLRGVDPEWRSSVLPEVEMKRRLLISAIAAAAGGLVGVSLPQRASPVKTGDARSASARTSGPIAGASDPREAALGCALSELHQPSGDLRGLVALGCALRQLGARQMARVLEFVEREDSTLLDWRAAWLFERWLKQDPAAAGAWLRPRLDAVSQDGPAGYLSGFNIHVLMAKAWAAANPQAAFDYARAHPHCGLAVELLRQVSAAWRSRGEAALLAALLDFPAGNVRETALLELHRDWAERDPAAALASARTLPAHEGRDRILSDVLVAWAGRDPTAALTRCQALGLNEPALLSALLSRTVEKDPQQAIDWLRQLDAVKFGRCAPQVVEAWAKRDPAAALTWALANGVRLSEQSRFSTEVRRNGFERSVSVASESISPLREAYQSKPEETLAWMRSLSAGKERNRVTELLLGYCTDLDPALELFAQLPPDAAARTANHVGALFFDAPDKGRAWAMSLPPGGARAAAWAGLGSLEAEGLEPPSGPDRDAYLSGALDRVGKTPPPTERLAIIERIGDPILRRDMLDKTMEFYIEDGSYVKECRPALENAKVPEAWKQRWREALARPR